MQVPAMRRGGEGSRGVQRVSGAASVGAKIRLQGRSEGQLTDDPREELGEDVFYALRVQKRAEEFEKEADEN